MCLVPVCADAGHVKSEEQQSLAEDVGVESAATTGANKQTSEDDTKIPYPVCQPVPHDRSWNQLWLCSFVFQTVLGNWVQLLWKLN